MSTFKSANGNGASTADHVAFPFTIDRRGRTATADDGTYIRSLLEQVLFTAPGERVNRPTFGSGLNQLLFAPNDPSVVAAVQLAAESSVQVWLGDLLVLEKLQVEALDAVLLVEVTYRLLETAEVRMVTFRRGTFSGVEVSS